MELKCSRYITAREISSRFSCDVFGIRRRDPACLRPLLEYMLLIMTTLQIQIRDEIQGRVSARVAEGGSRSVEEYVEWLIAADAIQDENDDDIEQLLLERLDNDAPSIEMTPEFIAQFKQKIAEKISGGDVSIKPTLC
jgi:cytochrome P450